MKCMDCGSAKVTERRDRTAQGYQRFRCRACRRGFNERSSGVSNSVAVIRRGPPSLRVTFADRSDARKGDAKDGAGWRSSPG